MSTYFRSNRTEEMNNSHLAELEDDIQQQIARTEERVRAEVSVTPAVVIVDNWFCDSLEHIGKSKINVSNWLPLIDNLCTEK